MNEIIKEIVWIICVYIYIYSLFIYLDNNNRIQLSTAYDACNYYNF